MPDRMPDGLARRQGAETVAARAESQLRTSEASKVYCRNLRHVRADRCGPGQRLHNLSPERKQRLSRLPTCNDVTLVASHREGRDNELSRGTVDLQEECGRYLNYGRLLADV